MKTGLRKIGLVLATLRELETDISMRTAQVFVTIAQNHPEGITQVEVAGIVGMLEGPISRHCATLSDTHWTGKKPGLGLIRLTHHPDGRHNRLILTKKGERFAARLVRLIESSEVN